ncbi:uncharacterized protein LOC126688342 [Mercurialis annua]|uniref:uncharacterized protein LOC126688342 n=1 Tax=Mercurialis annua TaxID=3986 RepID=UPI00215F9261|nr:uncharacterized protein LOC126688342 [Mercurialis annua]
MVRPKVLFSEIDKAFWRCENPLETMELNSQKAKGGEISEVEQDSPPKKLEQNPNSKAQINFSPNLKNTKPQKMSIIGEGKETTTAKTNTAVGSSPSPTAAGACSAPIPGVSVAVKSGNGSVIPLRQQLDSVASSRDLPFQQQQFNPVASSGGVVHLRQQLDPVASSGDLLFQQQLGVVASSSGAVPLASSSGALFQQQLGVVASSSGAVPLASSSGAAPSQQQLNPVASSHPSAATPFGLNSASIPNSAISTELPCAPLANKLLHKDLFQSSGSLASNNTNFSEFAANKPAFTSFTMKTNFTPSIGVGSRAVAIPISPLLAALTNGKQNIEKNFYSQILDPSLLAPFPPYILFK